MSRAAVQVSRHVRVPVRDVKNKFRSKITDVRARVAEALSVLGPSAGESTQKLINDIGTGHHSDEWPPTLHLCSVAVAVAVYCVPFGSSLPVAPARVWSVPVPAGRRRPLR